MWSISRTTALCAAIAAWAAPSYAQTASDDHLVQPHALAAPEKASLAGSLAGLAFGPGELVRGSLRLPLPLSAPEERGPLLGAIQPAYSPDGALTEIGQGWELAPGVRRFRPLGDVKFDAGDQLTSPWGALALGDDGAYYPLGQGKGMRATIEADGGLRVITGAGATYTFAAADAIAGSGGTFEWRLSEVRDVAGQLARLAYERNATGRPFLRRVQYGGRTSAALQYEIELVYDQLDAVGASVVRDYRAGKRYDLDRRVREIRIKTRHSGVYETRVTYALGYIQSATGTAFYLSTLDAIYRSGERAPTIRYGYDIDVAPASQPPVTVGGLSAFLQTYGGGALQPRAATLLDIDDDGLLDVEHAAAHLLLHQTAPGAFTEVPLVPSPAADARCRPAPQPNNPPRTLARMAPDAAAPSVVVLSRVGATASEVVECQRDGSIERVRPLTSVWQLDARTRLSDIDRDGRPDIVRVSSTQIEVLSNQPAAWVEQPAQSHAAFSVISAWLHDMNGDGIVDVVAVNPSGLGVWYGRGRSQFEAAEIRPRVELDGGGIFSGWSGALSFVDANADGATDVVVTSGSVARLFMNHGQVGDVALLFQEAALPALPGLTKYPLAAELNGSGEHALTWIDGAVATTLPLTRASTGLLTFVDDGKGTTAQIDYARAAPAPGLRSRPVVLHTATMTTAGEQALTRTYAYKQPRLHGAARYLVGFTEVTASGPDGSETVTFHNDDDYSGLVVATTRVDAADPIERFSFTFYEDVPYHGLRLMRVIEREDGVAAPGGVGAISETTRTLAYARGICPTSTELTSRHGVLTTNSTLADVAALPADLHCLVRREERVGVHADASRNFTYITELARDPIGKTTHVTALPGPGTTGSPLLLQELRYDGEHRLTRVIVPGEGETAFTYDAITGNLVRVVGPDGVAHETVRRDAVTDLVLSQRTERAATVFSTYFRHDGLERLAARWDDAAGSETAPNDAFRYYYATATGALAQVVNQTRLDAAAMRTEIALATGDAESVATLHQIPDGWAIAQLQQRRRAALEASDYYRSPLASSVGEGDALGHVELLANAAELSKVAVLAPVGSAPSGVLTRRTLSTGVVSEEHVQRLVAGGDVIVEVDDRTAVHAEGRDEADRMVWRADEQGETTTFEYDALGRLVAITLPDGGRQLQHFDEFGRVARIARAGISTLAYAYDTLGRLSRTELRSSGGRLERSVTIERDAIGRVRRELSTLSDSGETRVVRYDYDGVVEGKAVIPGQLGRLSQVSGPGFTRRTIYDIAGRVGTSTLAIQGLGEVAQTYTYYADDTVASEVWTVRDAAGAVRTTTERRDEYDGFGRLARVRIDGAVLARFAYDGHGRIASAELPDGEIISYEYEPLTSALVGYHRTDPSGGNDGVRWSWNGRGLVETQTLIVGGVRKQRTYAYDDRRQLITNAGPAMGAYDYDAAGLPTSTTDLAGTRTFNRDGEVLDAGDSVYTFDDLGRVIARDDLALGYGPDGELAVAARGGAVWRFVHDESGQRIAKSVGGAVVTGYIGGGILTAGSYTVPFRINNQIVGVLVDGAYEPLLVEGTGTVVREGSAAANIATPFGVRAARGALAEAIDFIEKGYDPDLAIVRFGVRDYDPYLGRFLTPDPEMLSSMDACAASSLDCALYTFARNNPLSFVDSTGMTPTVSELASSFAHGFTGEAQRAWVSLTEPLRAASRGDPGARAALAKAAAARVGSNIVHSSPVGLAGIAVGELVGNSAEAIATVRQAAARISDGDFQAMAEDGGKTAFGKVVDVATAVLVRVGLKAAAKAPAAATPPKSIHRVPGGVPPPAQRIVPAVRTPSVKTVGQQLRGEFHSAQGGDTNTRVFGILNPDLKPKIVPYAGIRGDFEVIRLQSGRFIVESDFRPTSPEAQALHSFANQLNGE